MNRFFVFIAIVFAVLWMTSLSISSFFSLLYLKPISFLIQCTFGIWTMSLLYLIGEMVSRYTGHYVLKHVGAIILGTMSISFAVTVLGYVLVAINSVWPFLSLPQLGDLAIGTIFILSAWAVINNRMLPKVHFLSLDLSNGAAPDSKATHSPKNTSSLRIVQLTDIHLNGLKSEKWIQGLVDKVNPLNPDIICFTGDLFDVDPERLGDHFESLKLLKSKYTKLAVSGNHDFYGDYLHYERAINDIGFDLIDNKIVDIEGLRFVGISDKDGLRFGYEKGNPLKDIHQEEMKLPVIVLDHRPEDFEANCEYGIQLQLSGHTHWGQIPPWDVLVRLRYKYAAGLKRFKNSWIYTSKGTGTWGPPMRLFGSSEIVCLDLNY